MGADFSRIRMDPLLDFAGVELKQGGVLLDADFNEHVAVMDRRLRALASDVLGRSTVSSTTPDAFKIEVDSGTLFIGKGRLYVDGLLAENHGALPTEADEKLFDPLLAEPHFAERIDYKTQPYWPTPETLPTVGTHLVYLDVWQREVTHLEQPELIEVAVGVETSSRMQTVWQVKLLEGIARGSTCASPDEDLEGWSALIAPSTGRLTTGTFEVPPEDDPCELPPTGGYRGLENQTYRVEIHSPGAPGGTATFKWSRDNASVATRVSSMISGTELELQTLGRDDVLRFNTGDWVEITDDVRELSQSAGEMRQITVNEAARRITFAPALPNPMAPGPFPSSDFPRERNLRVKRWDQKGKVRQTGASGTTLFEDLDATGSGVITVPLSDTTLILENGVTVSFASDGVDAKGFRAGDYWVFAARTADASVEALINEPPRGIHHHYERLGIWDVDGRTVTDCRHPWPPPAIPAGGDNCACTVCVTPQDHASGQMTVQMAIDRVIQAGGGTVCLEVGNYALAEPVRIEGARSVRLTGKGVSSRLQNINARGAVMINKSQDITLDSFALLCRGSVTAPQSAIFVSDSHIIRIERLLIRVESELTLWSAIHLAGALMDISLRENAIMAPNGIRSGSGPTDGGAAGLADVRIENNTFECSEAAVRLAPTSVHQLVNRICGNRVIGCQDAGFILTGITTPGFGVEIASNVLSVLGHGIVASMSGLSVLDNDILQTKDAGRKQQRGISLSPGPPVSNLIADCQIVGNRIAGFDGAGIFVEVPLRSAMIKENQIAHVGAGLVFESREVLDQLSIENNQFDDVSGPALLAKGKSASYAATGNQIQISARGAGPAVIMQFEAGDGVFSHNECYRERNVDAPDVVLQANTLIVGNNRVVGGGISLELHVPREHFTVLGNICRGKITVLPGGGLPAPWAPLNLQDVV